MAHYYYEYNTKGKEDKIEDSEIDNYFGIHLHTEKALKDFRDKSGMKKTFTDEYQHHYWAAVGRLEMQDEILDVCIPLVLFNYDQEVSSGSVDFDLRTVVKVSESLSVLADTEFEKFMESCGNKISEKFPSMQWSIVPLNTLHVHPGSMSTFSGTDYDTDENDPGVCFPLDKGTDQASFSSILLHKYAEDSPILARTECRLFNEIKDKLIYSQGKCISYVRKIKDTNRGVIETMFLGPVVQTGYYLRDRLGFSDGKDITKIFTDIFDESQYEPNTNNIFEKHVKKKVHIGYKQKNKNASKTTNANKKKATNTKPKKTETVIKPIKGDVTATKEEDKLAEERSYIANYKNRPNAPFIEDEEMNKIIYSVAKTNTELLAQTVLIEQEIEMRDIDDTDYTPEEFYKIGQELLLRGIKLPSSIDALRDNKLLVLYEEVYKRIARIDTNLAKSMPVRLIYYTVVENKDSNSDEDTKDSPSNNMDEQNYTDNFLKEHQNTVDTNEVDFMALGDESIIGGFSSNMLFVQERIVEEQHNFLIRHGISPQDLSIISEAEIEAHLLDLGYYD